jgi:hypothetical protein
MVRDEDVRKAHNEINASRRPSPRPESSTSDSRKEVAMVTKSAIRVGRGAEHDPNG